MGSRFCESPLNLPQCLLEQSQPIAGLPRRLSCRESTCQSRRHKFNPRLRKTPWRRKWQVAPVFLSGESHGQRSLTDYSPQGLKRIRHDWATKQLQQHSTSSAGMVCFAFFHPHVFEDTGFGLCSTLTISPWLMWVLGDYSPWVTPGWPPVFLWPVSWEWFLLFKMVEQKPKEKYYFMTHRRDMKFKFGRVD